MTLVDVREGYRLWAPSYGEENPVSFLEDRLVRSMTPPLHGLRLLDAGCGTGRRLRGTAAAAVLGVDLSPEMLDAGRVRLGDEPGLELCCGDVRDLPVRSGSFDIVWCRLVIGHLSDCRGAYRELARAAAAGGRIIVSDFHPEAYRAGHRRTFRAGAAVHELEHHLHEVDDHLAAAGDADLVLEEVRQAEIGPEVRDHYERAGRPELYQHNAGLPLVLALAFRRR